MMRRGRVLLGLVMPMSPGMVVRGAIVRMARRHLMMDRCGICLRDPIEARRRAAAPGQACRGHEHAEQIGEGDDPPHPDPHRSCQSQQHSADKCSARQLHTLIAN